MEKCNYCTMSYYDNKGKIVCSQSDDQDNRLKYCNEAIFAMKAIHQNTSVQMPEKCNYCTDCRVENGKFRCASANSVKIHSQCTEAIRVMYDCKSNKNI